jgi:uncharacterized iron-regulated membrane protein
MGASFEIGRLRMSNPPKLSFKASIWRIHFLSGLLLSPFLLVVAATGLLYVFREELEPLLYRSMMQVTPGPRYQPIARQIAAAKGGATGWKQLYYLSPRAQDRAARVLFAAPDAEVYRYYYVNPFTAEVTGFLDSRSEFFYLDLLIHRTLLTGSVGRWLVEATTSWCVISLVTGLCLALARKNWHASLRKPNLEGSPRSIFRSLHVFFGTYFAGFGFVILITGLLFSVISGELLRDLLRKSGQLPAAVYSPPPSSPGQGPPITPDAAAATASPYLRSKPIDILLPADGSNQSYVISAESDRGYLGGDSVVVDQYTAKILGRLDRVTLGGWLELLAYPLHTGTIGGLPTKIIAALASLALLFLMSSGIAMLWSRRPKGGSGVPKGLLARVPAVTVYLSVVMGVLLPAAGIIMLLVWLLSTAYQGLRALVAKRG